MEGGEGGGGGLAGGVPLSLPHRGVEGRVAKDRDWRAGGLAEPRHVVQRDAGEETVAGLYSDMNLSFHIPRLNIRRLNVLAFS